MKLQGTLSVQKKVASGENPQRGTAWERVSHNDVVLTDVGQLFISLPKVCSHRSHSQTLCTHASLPGSGLKHIAWILGIGAEEI